MQVRYRQDRGGYGLNVLWAPAGGRPRPLDPERLFPIASTPEQRTVNQRLRLLRKRRIGHRRGAPLLAFVWFGWPIAIRVGRAPADLGWRPRYGRCTQPPSIPLE